MPSTLVTTAEPFVCGGSAATFASCVIHPMDLAKVSHHFEKVWVRSHFNSFETKYISDFDHNRIS